MKAAQFFGKTYEIASSKEDHFTYIPSQKDFVVQPDTDYVYMTSNNTIHGTEWQTFPTFDIPVICDMSSDFLSRPVDVQQFDLIYAGAQKNVGPAGVVVAIIKDEFLQKANDKLPLMLQYKTFVDHDSTYNTPPVFDIYFVNKVAHWLDDHGGLAAMHRRNQVKADMIYRVIDESQGFYKGHARKDSRSLMNVTFNLATPELEKEFVTQAAAQDLIGVKGHRSVGGCRASLYNAVTEEGCAALAAFMKAFQKQH